MTGTQVDYEKVTVPKDEKEDKEGDAEMAEVAGRPAE